MKNIANYQQFIDISTDIFSKRDDVLIFCMAKDGLKTHSSVLHEKSQPKKDIIKH